MEASLSGKDGSEASSRERDKTNFREKFHDDNGRTTLNANLMWTKDIVRFTVKSRPQS